MVMASTLGTNVAANTNLFIGPGGSNSAENKVSMMSSRAMTARNLFASGSGAVGNNCVFTVRVNNADTAITCTITTGNTTASDTTNTAAVPAFGFLDVHLTSGAAPAPGVPVWATFELN
jgi:hypothetical protein